MSAEGIYADLAHSDNCLTTAGRTAGFFWVEGLLCDRDGNPIARVGLALCPADGGNFASERYRTTSAIRNDYIVGKGMIYQGWDEDHVKRVTEEWLAEHPDPQED